jgi:hypothetical protein
MSYLPIGSRFGDGFSEETVGSVRSDLSAANPQPQTSITSVVVQTTRIPTYEQRVNAATTKKAPQKVTNDEQSLER